MDEVMPNRIMRESALASKSLAALSAEGERLFWRLILAADNCGRFYADPQLILARCFPRSLGQVTIFQVSAWLRELTSGADPVVVVYSDNGQQYLHFPSWARHQRLRSQESKFPPPPAADGGGLPQEAADGGGLPPDAATCGRIGIGIGVGSGGGSGVENTLLSPRRRRERVSPEGFEDWWALWPLVKKHGRKDAEKEWRALKPDEELRATLIAALRDQVTWPKYQADGYRFMKDPCRWLKGERWKDEKPPSQVTVLRPKNAAAMRQFLDRRPQ